MKQTRLRAVTLQGAKYVEKSKIAIAIWGKLTFQQHQIILHFGCTNNNSADCTFLQELLRNVLKNRKMLLGIFHSYFFNQNNL